MKIGVFHWSFDELGGGEVLAHYLGKALNTKVYSVIKHPKANELSFEDISDRIPFTVRFLRKVRSFDYLTWSNIDITELGDFDAVVTSGLTARALITPHDVMHVHYNHSPARWLYDLWHFRRKSKGLIKRNFILPLASEFFRVWDATVDNRVDYYFSNSPITQLRLWKYLKRKSEVLYPPIEVKKYRNKPSEDFFLFIGRLWQEKNPESAIKACIATKKHLILIGDKSDKKLIKKYNNNPMIEFKGRVSEQEKIDLLASCKAVIYPAIAEDFGIVPIEALASGKPVICSNTGFPPIVVGNERGIITDGTAYGIQEAIIEMENKEYEPDELMSFAEQFDFENFKRKLIFFLNIFMVDFQKNFKKEEV